MNTNLLQHPLTHDADVLDWTSWLRCLGVSKEVKELAIIGTGLNAKTYAVQLPWYRCVKDVATSALRSIISKPWTVEDPQCCSKFCPYGGKTGLWLLRLVQGYRYLLEVDIMKVQNLWWMNTQSPQRFPSHSSDPQTKVRDWMLQHDARVCYVACSVVCGNRVRQALATIQLHTRKNLHVLLGVDKLVLSRDVEEMQD